MMKRKNASFSRSPSKSNSISNSPIGCFRNFAMKTENRVGERLLPGKIYTLAELQNSFII